MSEPKLIIKEESSAKKTRSPPKKPKVEQSVPRKKKLKTDADKAAERAQHLRFGKAEITPDEASRMTKQQKRAMYAAAAARSAAHREVDQYEDDNVGTQALNEGVKSEEAVSDFSKNRYARKLKKKAKLQAKKNTPTAKSSAFGSDKAQSAEATSSEGNSNWCSRWWQKQDIQKSYRAATRSGGTAAQTAGGKAVSNGTTAAKSGMERVIDKGKSVVSTAAKEKSESPPQLYDLTALQRDANRLLGFTAQQTLDYAQSLYEKRLITYPRTDSRFLTEDMAASLPGLVTDTGRAFAVEEPIPIHVQQVIDGSKVTDHHALLPTKSMAKADLAALPAGERNVLRLIAARLLCAVGEPHRYAETTLTAICAEEEFSAKGKVVLSDGWKAMERKMLGELLGKQKEPVVLPDVQEQSQCSVADAKLKEGHTSPPKFYTEDTLLSAMQAAGADSMPEGVERQGIGTPATRAATIEKLVQKGFLERKGTKKTKVLLPTDKGKALITVMPEEIQSPEMTADWETKLLQIERGEMEPSEFMTEINTMITELVKNTEMKKGANALMKSKIIGVCPNCGANVVEREKGWFCENRECRFVLWKDNAFFKRLGKRLDSHVADKLLRDGRVRLKDCKSAKGKTYNATVLLSCEADGRSKFSLEFEGGC